MREIPRYHFKVRLVFCTVSVEIILSEDWLALLLSIKEFSIDGFPIFYFNPLNIHLLYKTAINR